jgi:ElaB/YqjD/DUF883 family membrane-anchored ribosome-binding protein
MAETRRTEASDADIRRLQEDINKLREDLSNLAQTMSDVAAGRMTAAYDRILRTSQDMKDQARGGAEAFAREMEQRPLTFLAGAFGVGLLIGLLVRGRN